MPRLWHSTATPNQIAPAITTKTSTTSRVSIQPLSLWPSGRELLVVGSAIQMGAQIGGHPGGAAAAADALAS
jgi:hypothetical protein